MSARQNLDSVQILRGVAAMAVVVHHACQMVADNGSRPAVLNQLAHLPEIGAAGVDIFFVISGFIMVYVARGSFGQPGATLDFWRRRILRIVPLYWFYTCAMLALMALPFAMKGAVFSAAYTLKSLLFLPAFVPGRDPLVLQPLLSPGWTLFYEIFFYLVFGLWLGRGSSRTLLPYLVTVFAATLGLGTLLGPESAAGVFLANPIVVEFLYGVLLGLLFVRYGAPSRRRGYLCLALSVAGFGLTALQPANFPLRWLYWGVPAALLVHGSLAFRATGPIPRLWVRLGDASYSIYLLHSFLTLTLGGVLRRGIVIDRLPPDLLILVTIALAAAGGWLAFLLVEKPLTRWVNAHFDPRTTPSHARPLPTPETR